MSSPKRNKRQRKSCSICPCWRVLPSSIVISDDQCLQSISTWIPPHEQLTTKKKFICKYELLYMFERECSYEEHEREWWAIVRLEIFSKSNFLWGLLKVRSFVPAATDEAQRSLNAAGHEPTALANHTITNFVSRVMLSTTGPRLGFQFPDSLATLLQRASTLEIFGTLFKQ